ncbi:Protein transport protein Sec31B [Camelus dromedarius]|uniref:Protein transport protein Sec31B n=1 Tax=Camelus dromedarius TaxID=9838 RepID=A0A5N4DKN2_CAMDR|nr:Protein transport protein Sec31B [Camelus dromedarius]
MCTEASDVCSPLCRFHKLIWGSFGNGLLEGSGVIAGGGDNGMLTLYNVTHILSSGKEPVIAQKQKHTGAVRALDFNPFQGNLLASGANDSEIFIWDLNNLSVPMTPGSKSQYREGDRLSSTPPPILLQQPTEDVKALSWNRQVQHILSSAHPSGKAVVWDLRKNEPIIKVSDHSNRMHCSGLAWHPVIATQLVLCSEDDRLPVIQLWDLRFASSPLKLLESHSRSSWLSHHFTLMMQVSFCPQISSSFSKGQPLPPLQVPEQVAQASLIPPLKKPPKWMRRPAGVSFAFGGKLVTFGLPSTPAHQVPQPCLRLVFISQVTTESEFLLRSAELQEALGSGNLLNYCQNKIQEASLQSEKMLWQFLKVTLEQDSRMKFLKLLGYSKDELQKKVATWLKSDSGLGESPQPKGDDLKCIRQQAFCSQVCKCSASVEVFKLLTLLEPECDTEPISFWTGNGADPPLSFLVQTSKHTVEEASASSTFFDELVPQNMTPWEIPTTEDVDGLLSQALLLGELGPAVELCLKEERFADAIILAQAGGTDLLKQTQERYLAKKKTRITPLLACVIQKNWKDMLCACSMKNWREALALLLTYSGPEKFPELCDILGTRMEQEGSRALTSEARLCYVCSGSVERLVECWAKYHQTSSPMALQDLMEKVMVLNRSLELLQGPDGVTPGPATTYRVTQYANLLAAQGSLVSTPSPRPRIFTPQSSLVMPSTPSHPSPCPGPRMQNTSDCRPPGFQAVQPSALGPGLRPGEWLSGELCRQSTEEDSWHGQHGFGRQYVDLVRGGPQDSLKNSPVPRGNLQRKKFPETFMPPAPITTPVMCLTPEPRGVLSSQPAVSLVSHAPPGAPGELSLQQFQWPPEKMEKKELPPEHQSLKISFEALLQRCSLSATDLKTKRKLDEAALRLEHLYEKLCEGTLSPHILVGLHEVARCVDTGSFEQGLAVHAQVVGCSSFSEVSSFMPVLKSVLTIAHKLRI